MKVALDVGHSDRDGGAEATDGTSEYEYWLESVDGIVKALSAMGYEVKVFNRGDYGYSVSKECKGINDYGADVAVSVHLNASDGNARGFEVIHVSSSGKRLANAICNELWDVQYTCTRGTKTPWNGRGETFLMKTKMPAVIVEAGFIDNDEDYTALIENRARISKAIALGINEYLISSPA